MSHRNRMLSAIPSIQHNTMARTVPRSVDEQNRPNPLSRGLNFALLIQYRKDTCLRRTKAWTFPHQARHRSRPQLYSIFIFSNCSMLACQFPASTSAAFNFSVSVSLTAPLTFSFHSLSIILRCFSAVSLAFLSLSFALLISLSISMRPLTSRKTVAAVPTV